MENDSTVAEAWKEYVFTVREQVSPLLRPIQPHSTKGNLCEQHFEAWRMCAKNWCRLSGNSLSFKSASTRCENASRTHSYASLVRSALHLPPWLKRYSSRSWLTGWLLGLGLYQPPRSRLATATFAKRK